MKKAIVVILLLAMMACVVSGRFLRLKDKYYQPPGYGVGGFQTDAKRTDVIGGLKGIVNFLKGLISLFA